MQIILNALQTILLVHNILVTFFNISSGTDTFAYLAGDSSTVDHSPTKYRCEFSARLSNNFPSRNITNAIHIYIYYCKRFVIVIYSNQSFHVKLAKRHCNSECKLVVIH